MTFVRNVTEEEYQPNLRPPLSSETDRDSCGEVRGRYFRISVGPDKRGEGGR